MDKKEEISKKYWEEKEFSYFSHRKCEFFPCHKNADGNNFNWIKDCSDCLYPHLKEKYGKVVERFGEIVKSMNEKR